jgi:hypothetical protein
MGYFDTWGFAGEAYVVEHYAYVADRYGLSVIDVTDVTDPQEVVYHETPGTAEGVYGNDGHIFLADNEGGMVILNDGLSPSAVDPETPPEMHDHQVGGNVRFESVSNPSADLVVICLQASRSAVGAITIHDLTGRVVRDLGQHHLPRGQSFLHWDGNGSTGSPVASGTYFIHLREPGGRVTARMTMLR